MATTPSSKSQLFLTPSSKPNQNYNLKTPQSKHRINPNFSKPSPNPNSAVKETLQIDHPVEVIGRIRDYPDRKEKPISSLQINSDHHSIRVKTEFGYRDFSLDGVSVSEEDDLDGFYKKFVESRINGVKLGDKCTIMMYGPTGSGKSHTMFGCSKEQGIVYKALRDILGDGIDDGKFVQATVLEIYNEEIYDLLLSNNGAGFNLGWSKGSSSKVKLEVMGKKAKNATFISGTEAVKISKEIQKVEKRRIVKSTLCNERSSRSHCMIILDVPTVGGRLMLVDMAGSENIEQAGQTGLEAKMQTAKINQGNIALKRVVESIANGDSHVPFRDSKLTMLLQDSFQDDKSKILMILCASPDPKEMHKTISTLEYGAKAKCIVRGPYTPSKDKVKEDSSAMSAATLKSRIEAMDLFIQKLQMESKVTEKERNEALKELNKKEEEVSALRAKLAVIENMKREEIINNEVNERTRLLTIELNEKVEECKRIAAENVEMKRRKMEDNIYQQQQELEFLKKCLEEAESEVRRSKKEDSSVSLTEGSSFAKRLMEAYDHDDSGMEKSMDLDKSLDLDMGKKGSLGKIQIQALLGYPNSNTKNNVDSNVFEMGFGNKAYLSTVVEEEEDESEDKEIQKEVIEEKKVLCATNSPSRITEDDSASRQKRIHNIFTLCGNNRELNRRPYPIKKDAENPYSPSSPLRSPAEDPGARVRSSELSQFQKSLKSTNYDENCDPIMGPVKAGQCVMARLPFSSLENKLPATPVSSKSPPLLEEFLAKTPFITHRRSVTKPKPGLV